MNDESPSVPEEPYPVSVLTGFLGSGKTTLLSHLLSQPASGRLAVIVNELGEIALDHHLVRQVDESTFVLDGGCLCCTVRDDLVTSLREMAGKREDGSLPAFDRVVIETTGLADPAPIVHTLMRDPMLGFFYRLDGLITTVDGVNAPGLLAQQLEAEKQVAMADRLIVTKGDLASAAALDALEETLRRLNPAAPIIRAINGQVDVASLFNAGLYNAETKNLQVRRWLAAEAYEAAQAQEPAQRDDHAHVHGHEHPDLRHDSAIKAYCFTREAPVAWDRLAAWIETMILSYGDRLLRIKGIVNAEGEAAPIALHGVQHLFHPPVMLDAWPDLDHRTRLVVIARNLDRETLERSLASFLDG